MNVLVSSAGRRGALIRLIRDTLRPLGGRVFAVDAAGWSSACRLADGWSIVPPFDDESYFDTIASYCHANNIQLIIPTHDQELRVYAQLSPLFAELGISVACSGPETIRIASDKEYTDDFLRARGLPSVARIHLEMVHEPLAVLPFPLVVKPRHGSGSAGVQVVRDHEELHFYLKRTEAPIIQQLAQGREFTTNCFIGRDGQCKVAVPHWRVETRGGEVSKCVTVREPSLIELADRLAGSLPDAYGPFCFQAFVDDDHQVQIIELNARFGGGYPVAHRAGANFVKLLVDERQGWQASTPDWIEGLAMTRWDDAVFWQTGKYSRCA